MDNIDPQVGEVWDCKSPVLNTVVEVVVIDRKGDDYFCLDGTNQVEFLVKRNVLISKVS